jgi:hypothetical protein
MARRNLLWSLDEINILKRGMDRKASAEEIFSDLRKAGFHRSVGAIKSFRSALRLQDSG